MARKKKDQITFKSKTDKWFEITATDSNLLIIAILAREAAEVERMKKHMALHELYQNIHDEITEFLKEGNND